jgi:hypothetical protein
MTTTPIQIKKTEINPDDVKNALTILCDNGIRQVDAYFVFSEILRNVFGATITDEKKGKKKHD